jgi:hypothetical protein
MARDDKLWWLFDQIWSVLDEIEHELDNKTPDVEKLKEGEDLRQGVGATGRPAPRNSPREGGHDQADQHLVEPEGVGETVGSVAENGGGYLFV